MSALADLPETLHCLRLSDVGFTFWIDADARREVERWLRGAGPFDGDNTLDVVTIHGEDLTLIHGKVVGIWSSTVQSRASERNMNRQLEDEVPVSERG
jgi:hypothetical protein